MIAPEGAPPARAVPPGCRAAALPGALQWRDRRRLAKQRAGAIQYSRGKDTRRRLYREIKVPLDELPAHLPDLVRENRSVVVVCKTDRRSSMAAQQLQEAGMSDVSVLRGGMEQWRVLGLPAR